MGNRPTRIRIANELGNAQTLPDERSQFEIIPGNRSIVFLGLGPNPGLIPEYFPEQTTARYIECPRLSSQIEGWEAAVPSTLTAMEPNDFTPAIAASSTIIRYRPGLKSFPTFWGPLTGRTVASRIKPSHKSHTVWLPLTESDLLGRELAIAFKARGYAVRFVDRKRLERSPGTELPAMLKQETPTIFFSVNFKGLEPFGLGYNILREAGVQTAIWLVDNPFNILTSVKSGYWKEVPLFVTDQTFITPLISNGAQQVTHLPLAACPELFATENTPPKSAQQIDDKLVFVGRSEFPQKTKFFAGLTPNPRLLSEAIAMLDRGGRPHFHWWQNHILATQWPGNEVRHVGIGAEIAGYAWRVRCLAAAGSNAVIFGDDKWGQIEEITADVRSPLDYYAHLPAVYRKAAVSLNITGMQLPAGLTQRHFDVWCAGGFLITDNNPGLNIFPQTLTDPITFKSPAALRPLFEAHMRATPAKEIIRTAWRELILREHTYHNRIAKILTTLHLEH